MAARPGAAGRRGLGAGFLQTSLGESVTASGLLFLPLVAVQMVAGLAAGPLSHRLSGKLLLVLGAIPVIAGFGLLAAFHSAAWQVVLATAIAGLGFGASLSALSIVVVHAVPAAHTGAATGMNANIRTIGGALGAAVVTAILSTSGGYPVVFLVLAGAALLGLISCLLIPGADRSASGAEGVPAAARERALSA